MSEGSRNHGRVSRRTMLRIGAAGTAATGMAAAKVIATPDLEAKGWANRNGLFEAAAVAWSDAIYIEKYPTSPLILSPFTDPLPVPKAARPTTSSAWKGWAEPPRKARQSSVLGTTHQKWCDETPGATPGREPIVYEFDLLVRGHAFTTSKVLPIDSGGSPAPSFDATGRSYPAGTVRDLPQSTIYGFNGTFPGPMVNAEYGKPVVIRFRNKLDENPWQLDRQDFGSPDWSFLTHLHNAHTAPESDGNPHYTMKSGPKLGGLPAGRVGRQPVPELAGRQRRPGEAELLLVPRPPDGPHRLQRLQGHGRALPDLRPEGRLPGPGHVRRRAAGPAAARRPHRQRRRLLRRQVRHPAGVLRLPSRRRRHHPQGHPRRERASSRRRRTRAPTPSGGARRSSSTSRTTASSATSSP